MALLLSSRKSGQRTPDAHRFSRVGNLRRAARNLREANGLPRADRRESCSHVYASAARGPATCCRLARPQEATEWVVVRREFSVVSADCR